MQETILKLVQTVNSYLADYILIILLVGTGLFFSIKTRFVQVRCFGEGMKRFSVTFHSEAERTNQVSAPSRRLQLQLPVRLEQGT